MELNQFKFKPSLRLDVVSEAMLKTSKDVKVEVLKNKDGSTTLIKTNFGKVVYNVLFFDDVKLNKALKNISKR